MAAPAGCGVEGLTPSSDSKPHRRRLTPSPPAVRARAAEAPLRPGLEVAGKGWAINIYCTRVPTLWKASLSPSQAGLALPSESEQLMETPPPDRVRVRATEGSLKETPPPARPSPSTEGRLWPPARVRVLKETPPASYRRRPAARDGVGLPHETASASRTRRRRPAARDGVGLPHETASACRTRRRRPATGSGQPHETELAMDAKALVDEPVSLERRRVVRLANCSNGRAALALC